jgi:hypothetical protein
MWWGTFTRPATGPRRRTRLRSADPNSCRSTKTPCSSTTPTNLTVSDGGVEFFGCAAFVRARPRSLPRNRWATSPDFG